MSTTSPASTPASAATPAAELLVVAATAPLAATILNIVSGTDVTTIGPSDTLAPDCITAATLDRSPGAYRPVFVAASTDSIEETGPILAPLRCGLAANHVAISLCDPDHDVDIVWGHAFNAGLLTPTPTGEPPLAQQLTQATGHLTAVAPLRIVREGPDALAASLAFDAVTDHAFTLIDGADKRDLTTIARTIAYRPLNVGTPSLLRALLRERLARPAGNRSGQGTTRGPVPSGAT